MGVLEFENSPESGLNGGAGTPTSWRSSDTPDEQSLSPTSCTPLSDSTDGDLNFTIGVTENTPYACHFCEKAFPRLSYLKRHEQIHTDHMPFKCDYCNRLFKHKRSRDRHVKLHTGDRKYRCGQCDSAFSRSDHLKIHMKTHDTGKPYQCAVCNRGYSTAAALTSHMQNHQTPRETSFPFRCLQCPAIGFSTARELQMHVTTHDADSPGSDKKLACTFCTNKFPDVDSLKKHVERKHDAETKGHCPVCLREFSSLEDLLEHKKTHDTLTKQEDSPVSANFSCGLCSRNEFPTMDSLHQHMQEAHVPLSNSVESSATFTSSASPISDPRTTPDTPNGRLSSPSHECDYCTMKFTSVYSLQRHTLNIHVGPPDLKSENFCSRCCKQFSSELLLEEHVKSVHEKENGFGSLKHHAEIEYHCRTKSVSPREMLMQGAPMFNGTDISFSTPGTFLCNQCDAALPDFESFRSHLKCHLDSVVKKYSCIECDGQFSTEEHLDKHIAKHYLSTTIEYGCQSCLKMFVKPDHLQRHLMDTHAHQLYQCALCKEIFESKVSMQVHFSMKHSNQCHLYKCTSCNNLFRTDVEFALHVKMAHLSKVQPLRCPLCNLCFASDSLLQLHFQNHKKFSCMFCSEEFHVEFLLDRHVQEKHSGENVLTLSHTDMERAQNLCVKPSSNSDSEINLNSSAKKQLRCDICDTSFSSESSLSVHRRQVHNIRTSGSQKPGQTTLSLFCAYCSESCKSRTELENHMKAHVVSPSKHKCNICDEVCPSAGTLAEHKLSHCKVVTDSTCVACHIALTLEEHFYIHLHQHNPQGLPAPCVICRQTLMSEVEVQVHAKHHLKNNSDAVYSCCVCAGKNTLQNLIITGTQDSHSYMCKDCFHAKADDLRCHECHVKFENVIELEKHKTTHRKTYQCIKCQMTFDTEAEIQMHVTTHVLQEGTNHACHICQRVYDSPAKLQCHLIEHTFEGCSSYRCYICSAVFTSSFFIQQHMLEHGLDARPYDCGLCHQKFFFRAELENHTFFHPPPSNDGANFKCTICPKAYVSLKAFQYHCRTHDLKTKNPSLKCSACPGEFENSFDMQQHYFKSHTESDLGPNEKSCFPCTECDQVFPCMSNLQGHLRIHSQGSKFTCPKCPKEFALSKNLTIHMRSHSGVKPYECPMCNKRFARKENRRMHIKSHTGQKPFMCPHCGKTFSRKCHVKEHMRIHITSTTYPCEMCTQTFTSTALLKQHLVEAHGKRFDFTCSVCKELFESSESLDAHLLKEHDVRTSDYVSFPGEDLSESSLGQSSSSADHKDLDSSDSNSPIDESDPRESPTSIVVDNIKDNCEAEQTV